MADITISAMGVSGVDVDSDPLTMSDDALRNAQNVFHNTSDREAGGLRVRPGLTAFIAAPFTGPILGGIGMAVRGTAHATGAGGGPGTGGTGPGDGGGPGTTGSGSPTGGSGGTPTGPFNPTGGLFGGARLIVMGRTIVSSSVGGRSWFVTSENWADTPLVLTGPPGPPNVHKSSSSNGPVSPGVGAPGAGCVLDGSLYYWGGVTNVTGNQRPTIRRSNGYDDQLVATVPKNPLSLTTGPAQSVLSMLAADGAVWFTEITHHSGAGSGPVLGRIFKLDPEVNRLHECPIDASFGPAGSAAGLSPYALEFYNGQIYIGAGDITTTGASWLFSLVPTESGADSGNIGQAKNAPQNFVGCLKAFDGDLYVGYGCMSGTAVTGAFAVVDQRRWGATGTLDVVSTFTPTGPGATGATGNYFTSMAVFNSALYAAYYNPGNGSAIYKYDGTAWSTAFASSGAAQLKRFFLFPDKDTLYAIGVGEPAATGARYIITADGASWIDKTSNIPTGSSGSAFPLLFGFDQTGAA